MLNLQKIINKPGASKTVTNPMSRNFVIISNVYTLINFGAKNIYHCNFD